jgi:hypothetical protein
MTPLGLLKSFLAELVIPDLVLGFCDDLDLTGVELFLVCNLELLSVDTPGLSFTLVDATLVLVPPVSIGRPLSGSFLMFSLASSSFGG